MINDKYRIEQQELLIASRKAIKQRALLKKQNTYDKEKVEALLKNHTAKETAGTLGISSATLYRFMKKHGIKPTKRFDPYLESRKGDVILTLEKRTVVETAKTFGISRSTLLRFIKKHGIKVKRTPCKGKFNLIKDQIIRLLKENSGAGTARILGVSVYNLYIFMKEHGLRENLSRSKLDPMKEKIKDIKQ